MPDRPPLGINAQRAIDLLRRFGRHEEARAAEAAWTRGEAWPLPSLFPHDRELADAVKAANWAVINRPC